MWWFVGSLGSSSPPKSGCNALTPPMLMWLMKLVEFVSTGALVMSRFHQLLPGKSGSGVGSGPPCVGCAWTDDDAPEITSATRAGTRPRIMPSTLMGGTWGVLCALPPCDAGHRLRSVHG